MEPGRAAHRPTGLALGPDGSLYIADDKAGRIWRVTYAGDKAAEIASAAPVQASAIAATEPVPPEGINPAAGLPIPRNGSPDRLALGDRIFHGQANGGTCAGCHGADGKGSAVGSDLTSGHWVWSDGSVASIAHVIRTGVLKPKTHTGVMPPMGGVSLSDAQLTAVAEYVWAIGHRPAK
jgi:mono/diheme cytochrome c family protein